jgi:choline dehydrogenase-like flavoprotein
MNLLSSLPPADRIYDVCVVGAGPVGLAFALEAAQQGLQVLLLDAGTEDGQGSSETPAISPPAHLVDPERHAPMALATRRGVGGTSWLWGGRCVPYEPIDFERRSYVPHSDWPLSQTDILPWHQRAAYYLDCGSADFRSKEADWPGMPDFNLSNFERWAKQPKLAPRLTNLLQQQPAISLLCEAMVTDLVFNADTSALTGLSVVHRRQTGSVNARQYVLAAGGLSGTRLLLSVQRKHPALFGGVDGPLGRFYMGHIAGAIASLVLSRPADFKDLDFHRDESQAYVRRRLTLTDEAQRRHGLLNTCFFADNPPFHDASHRNATLSLVLLALAFKPVGGRLISEGIRLRHIGPAPRHYGRHLLNVATRPWQAVADVVGILRHRYLSAVRKPGFVLRNNGGTYALHYHAEQIPNPDSRVTLNGQTGPDGLPCLDIDFRYTQQDVDSVLRAHQYLDEQLRSAGHGRIEYLDPEPQRAAAVMAQATDGFHQIGTTRMSDDPTAGVVDRDCRVHGVGNLFIASSSNFPTAGEANPTFLAVCLALRLAHHLATPSTATDQGQ